MAGLWSQPDVPHAGWRCIGVVDLRPTGDGDYEHGIGDYEPGLCEMCGNEQLRFVHTMEHSEYPDRLEVGRICAEKMATGYDGKTYELALKRRAARRDKWLTRRWRVSKKGNLYLNIDNENIGITGDRFAPGKWKWRINSQFSQEHFDTIDEAKLALFDELANYLEW